MASCFRNVEFYKLFQNLHKKNIFVLFFSETGLGNYALRTTHYFLFSIVNPQGVAPSKMPLLKNQQNAINCNQQLWTNI